MRWIFFVPLVAVVALYSCEEKIGSRTLIDNYSRSECISVRFGPGIHPPTRTWDYTLTTREGIAVQVSGAEMPGGRIDVRYAPNGRDEVAADAGDYIYPDDVRFDPASEQLYIRASGSPATSKRFETWLFEYDVPRHRQTKHAKVDPNVLPPECQIK